MRLLILGANGQLGRAMVAACGPDIALLTLDRAQGDISSASIVSTLVALRPDVVVNCAAWTNVDGAEQAADAAFAANALGAWHVASGCAACGATLVHISTNEVFAGVPGRFYYEYDLPSPNSVYARSKLAGERAVSQVLDRLYIVRVSWLFGPGGNNFPSKIIAAADRHGALRVVDEEFGNPTYAPDVAEAILKLVHTRRYGIYHFVNSGYTSRFELARELLTLSGRVHVNLTPIKLADWPRPAPPPPHAVLVNQTAASLGITLRPWQKALREFVELSVEKLAAGVERNMSEEKYE